jgi:hypothetical protein
MGISLGDIASFATGVVDADTAATQEKLKDRRAELQADRQLYIDMKTRKYESELKAFEAEDKKYKAIQSVNSKFEGSEAPVIPSDYGKAYLMETNPQLLLQYQTLYKENPNELNKILSTFGDKSIVDFKTSTSRDALDTKLKTDINAITAGYKKALENARGDSKLINAILGKRDKEIKLVIEQNKDGETGAIAAKEIATQTDSNEARGFEFGDEPKVANTYLFNRWKKDSKIQDLRKAVKDKVSSINKGTIDTTLNTLGSLNIQLPKQFLTFEQGKTSGTITGIKDKGKIVVEHITLLDNQALNFMSNEWIFGKDTEATNVSNYYSAIAAKNLTTSRVRDYSSEGTVNQQKKGFWSDRENFVGFVPFSVVGLDNNFIYKEDGGGVIINSDSRKQVGSLYYQTLKKIAMSNDPEFKNSTESEAINKLQDKLLKLREGDSSNLLTQVKNEMATSMKLNEPKVEENTDAPINKNNDNTSLEGSITVYRKDGSIVSNNLGNTVENLAKVKEDGYTFKENINDTTNEPIPLVPQETDEGYDPEYNTGKDRSITAGTIRRLKRGNTTPMSQKERLEARRIQKDFRKKQKEIEENKNRNETLGLPEIQPLKSE